MPYLMNPYFWLALVGVVAADFGAGAWWQHTREEKQAAVNQATQDTATRVVTQTVTVTDKAATNRLAAQLAAQRQRADTLQQLISEAQHANPAIPDDCRVPASVRAALDADLATGAQ